MASVSECLPGCYAGVISFPVIEGFLVDGVGILAAVILFLVFIRIRGVRNRDRLQATE